MLLKVYTKVQRNSLSLSLVHIYPFPFEKPSKHFYALTKMDIMGIAFGNTQTQYYMKDGNMEKWEECNTRKLMNYESACQ